MPTTTRTPRRRGHGHRRTPSRRRRRLARTTATTATSIRTRSRAGRSTRVLSVTRPLAAIARDRRCFCRRRRHDGWIGGIERSGTAHRPAPATRSASAHHGDARDGSFRRNRPARRHVLRLRRRRRSSASLLAWRLHLVGRTTAATGRADELLAAPRPDPRLVAEQVVRRRVYQTVIVEPLRVARPRLLPRSTAARRRARRRSSGWLPRAAGWALQLDVQRGYLQGYAVAMAARDRR